MEEEELETIWLLRVELLFELFDFNKTGFLIAPKDLLFFLSTV